MYMFAKLKNSLKSFLNKIKLKSLDEKSLKEPIQELIELMIANEVAVDVATKIGQKVKEELIAAGTQQERFKDVRPLLRKSLRKAIREVITPTNGSINLIEEIRKKREIGEPYVIVMEGINGTGKTTTMAKLAHKLQKEGFSVVFAASDTYRAGAIDQLTKHGQKLGIKTISHQQGGDPTAVAIDAIDHAYAKGVDVVMIDTAGRMQNNSNLIRELQKVVSKTEADLKIFVGDSLAGNDVINQAKEFNEKVGIDTVIMTKADSDVKGGAAISVAHTIDKPILYLGVGQGYDDLQEFDADYLVNQIIPN